MSELLTLRKQLADLLGSNKDLKAAIMNVNRIDIIKASLIARDPRHESIPVSEILEGALQRDVPVGDYLFIQNCEELVKVAYANIEMGNSLDANLLIKGYRILSEDPDGFFRSSNPVVYAFNHVPIHSVDIDSALGDTIRKLYRSESGDNPVLKAMFIHNKIIEIWPFDEFSGELAVFAMNYYLMENGLMPVGFSMERQDYLDLVAACLKGCRQDEFYNFLKETITDRMESTINACRSFAG